MSWITARLVNFDDPIATSPLLLVGVFFVSLLMFQALLFKASKLRSKVFWVRIVDYLWFGMTLVAVLGLTSEARRTFADVRAQELERILRSFLDRTENYLNVPSASIVFDDTGKFLQSQGVTVAPTSKAQSSRFLWPVLPEIIHLFGDSGDLGGRSQQLSFSPCPKVFVIWVRTGPDKQYLAGDAREPTAEFQSACAFAFGLANRVRDWKRGQGGLDVTALTVGRPEVTAPALVDYFVGLDDIVADYRETESELGAARATARTRAPDEVRFRRLWPVLIAFVLGLRVTKVTAEQLADRRGPAWWS